MDFQMLNSLMRMTKGFAHEQIRKRGLNDTECMICSYVYEHENCSQEDVSKALCIDKTTVTKSMQLLEHMGILLRSPDEEDKRRHVLSLTADGKEKCSKVLHVYDEWVGKVMEELNGEEQKQFESYCRRLISAAQKLQEERKRTEEQ